jgi:hypothetical protein
LVYRILPWGREQSGGNNCLNPIRKFFRDRRKKDSCNEGL